MFKKGLNPKNLTKEEQRYYKKLTKEQAGYLDLVLESLDKNGNILDDKKLEIKKCFQDNNISTEVSRELLKFAKKIRPESEPEPESESESEPEPEPIESNTDIVSEENKIEQKQEQDSIEVDGVVVI